MIGLETADVVVEVDLRAGLPTFTVVGLADAAVQEARERVRSGLANQGFAVPARRIVAGLAPADLRKAGPQYDLPLALAILAASGQIAPGAVDGVGCAGELALDGGLRPVPGALSMAEHALRRGWRRLVVPAANAAEAALVEGVQIVGASGLREAVDALEGRLGAAAQHPSAERLLETGPPADLPDLAEVRGQAAARRALEIAAAGGHSLLLVGPPGGGKTMLARRLPGIMPPLAVREALEITRIHSVAGLLNGSVPLVVGGAGGGGPHTISAVGLTGGGRIPRPGEVSLAHRGVLFLDEVWAFAPSALNALRQPLEEGVIEITRAMTTLRFPAAPVLVCAGNPCPCGFLGDSARPCICPPGRAEAYRARLSGPVADRLDLRVEVGRLDRAELLGAGGAESSATVRARVVAARERQGERGQTGPNAGLGSEAVREVAALTPGARDLLASAIDRLALSARGHDRLLRVARTIADLDGAEGVTESHLGEALGYRERPAG